MTNWRCGPDASGDRGEQATGSLEIVPPLEQFCGRHNSSETPSCQAEAWLHEGRPRE
jgi:hypothetical protein